MRRRRNRQVRALLPCFVSDRQKHVEAPSRWTEEEKPRQSLDISFTGEMEETEPEFSALLLLLTSRGDMCGMCLLSVFLSSPSWIIHTHDLLCPCRHGPNVAEAQTHTETTAFNEGPLTWHPAPQSTWPHHAIWLFVKISYLFIVASKHTVSYELMA